MALQKIQPPLWKEGFFSGIAQYTLKLHQPIDIFVDLVKILQ